MLMLLLSPVLLLLVLDNFILHLKTSITPEQMHHNMLHAPCSLLPAPCSVIPDANASSQTPEGNGSDGPWLT
jgi:hypothetical protein